MTIKSGLIKRIPALLFVLFLFLGFVRSDAWSGIENISAYLAQDEKSEDALTPDTMEGEMVDSLWMKNRWIDLNGAMAGALSMQGFYSDMGMYVTKDNYIVSASAQTSTDYETEQTVAFRDFLEEHGVQLLYVNEPTKYTDDALFRKSFGVETYSNSNMDRFLGRLREAGVNTLDLRECAAKEGMEITELFYRTDHHWTTEAALWASGIMVEKLNEISGYETDLSLYDPDQFERKEWKNCWLGEQGRKVARTYVGLDDYTEIKPAYETSYTFKAPDGSTYEGTFDNFIAETVFDTEKDVYESISWHYAYNMINCINHNVPKGKVLLLGDSYDQVTHPFLSLGVHELDTMCLRYCEDTFDLRQYILDNGYDTVIIAYAQFMVGAHDDPQNANYRMFKFE